MVGQRARVLAGLVLLVVSVGCGDAGGGGDDDDVPSEMGCVEGDLLACDLLYPATWAEVYSQTIEPGCVGGAACHGDAGAAGAGGGFYVDDAAGTYARLLGGSEPLVVPGDPACSPLIMRLESEDPAWAMPPGGTKLAAGVRCSVARWIGEGAAE